MESVSDLRFFAVLVKRGSLSAAAQELGITPPAVSRRLAALESRLGVRLLNRTTRRMHVTQEGELYLVEGQRILREVDDLEEAVASARDMPRGFLRVNSTFGFGRLYIAPALSEFACRFPEVEVQLHLTDRPMNLAEEGFDVGIRFGQMPDSRLIAKRLATDRRVLCAAPRYLELHSAPQSPRELPQHRCIVIRQGAETYGTWNLSSGDRHEVVKVKGPMCTNSGEIAVAWALDGHGILLRAEWNVAEFLRSGQLKTVLDEWELPPADIFAVFPVRTNLSAKVRAFVDFLSTWLNKRSWNGH